MYSREQAEKEMAREIRLLEKSLAMPTTGNKEQDEAYIHEAAISSVMIAANKCPNGHGEMEMSQIDRTLNCSQCGFTCNNL